MEIAEVKRLLLNAVAEVERRYEQRRIDYEHKARMCAQRPIKVDWGDCGHTITGQAAEGSAMGDSIRLVIGLPLSVERSIFAHELGHVVLRHASRAKSHVDPDPRHFFEGLPEDVQDQALAMLNEKEAQAHEFGRRILPLLWPGEWYQLTFIPLMREPK